MKKLIWLLILTAPFTLYSGSEIISEEEVVIPIEKNKSVGYFFTDTGSKIVCILLPGGPQTKEITVNMNHIALQFNKRGFSTAAVYSSIGPLINMGHHSSLKYLQKILDKIKLDQKADGFIICGFSNGGTGGIQIAEKDQKSVKAVLAVPGAYTPKKLTQPIYLRIGEKDKLGWAKSFDKIKKSIVDAGGKLDAKVVKGAGHIFPLNWPEIELWLKKHKLMK